MGRKLGYDDHCIFSADREPALKAIRKQGYSVSVGEVDIRNAGIAAPILSPEKRAIGCLVLVVPRAELDETTIPEIAEKLIEGAREIAG